MATGKIENSMGEYFDLFRKRLVNLLKERRIQQKDLAKQIDIDPSYINQLLTGTRRFNEDTIELIVNALNVTPCDLFTENQPTPPVVQRIIKHYNIDMYRKGIEYFEEQTFMGCVQNGLIDPEKKSIGCAQSVCNFVVRFKRTF